MIEIVKTKIYLVKKIKIKIKINNITFLK